MKRIAIFSDTHGNIHPCLRLIPGLGTLSLIIHLGDMVIDGEELHMIYPNIPFLSVKGNNDWFSTAPLVTTHTIHGVGFLCCHGHTFSPSQLIQEAKKQHCQVALFGHTHRSFLETTDDGMLLMNPGSVSRPRDSFASCGIIEIENGMPKGAILPLS